MEQIHLPSSYRGIIDSINELINDGNKALCKPNEDGIIQPVKFVDELVDLYGEVKYTLGKIEDKVHQLQNNNSESLCKYESAISTLKELEIELSSEIKGFGRK